MLRMREYGENIASMREAQGKTQAELAEAANRSTHCIQSVEAGRSNVTIDTLVSITGALHTDWRVLWLLCWRDAEIVTFVRRLPRLPGDPKNVLGFCQNIVLLRKSKGLTQKRLARMAGVSETWLRDIEHGCANVTVRKLARVANALDMSLLELSVMSVPEAMLLERLRDTKAAMGAERPEGEPQYVSI